MSNVYDNKNYIILIKALKQALDHGLKLKKVHRVTEFNQEAWLKPIMDMKTEPRMKTKFGFDKILFKLMNNLVHQPRGK